MDRPEYLSRYYFDWELLEVILEGRSALDAKSYMGPLSTKDEVYNFLKGYGLDPDDPVLNAELYGNFQESLQFTRKYFLKEQNPDGLSLSIPVEIYRVSEVSELFLMGTGGKTEELRLWASIILKVMHTVVHVDKDLRHNYFSVIQQQILDRYYRYIKRDESNNLYLGDKKGKIQLVDFQSKAKKTRDSVIMKLIHKVESVADELFDRVGVRIVTKNRIDTLRVVKFLHENNIVMPHNIKQSRSLNNIVNLRLFRRRYRSLIRLSIRNQLDEKRFIEALEREIKLCLPKEHHERNLHSSQTYRSMQFTARQLINYRNPFLKEFQKIREVAKDYPADEKLAQGILDLDITPLVKDVRFFYPYEVQVVDNEIHKQNTEGEASHKEYKKNQQREAMKRLFSPLIEYLGINSTD